MLDEGGTFGINRSIGAPEISINFSKMKTKICLSLHYNEDKNELFINGKESNGMKIE